MNTNNKESETWAYPSRFFLRFFFIYIVLYIVPYGFEYIKAIDVFEHNGFSIWTTITPKFGETFLGLSYDYDWLASGLDSKFDFTRFLLIAILGFIISIIWNLVDSKFKLNYNIKLNTLFRVILRYHVGFTLLLYGMVKVIPLQFGVMDISSLETKLGDYRPMWLLWTFMSYSPFYTSVTGCVEVLGALLLLFRRTTLVGGLICFVAMANVVLIDIGYDVTVKMFAIHLFLMVVLLLFEDVKRIIDFLILNKPTSPKAYPPLLGFRYKIHGHAIKFSLLLYIFITLGFHINKVIDRQYDQTNASLRKLYQVEEFTFNGDTLAPLLTDSVRWKNFTIGGLSHMRNILSISMMDDDRKLFFFEADTLNQSIDFHAYRDSTDIYSMKYQMVSPEEFLFYGTHGTDSLWMKATIKNKEDYRLMKQERKWIRDLE